MNEVEFDDFFDINSISNEINVCAYCGKTISLMQFKANDKDFCDVICAKLYGDEHGWKSYKYDKRVYDLYYKNRLLSSTAMAAYQVLRSINIAMLPTMVDVNERESKETRKNKYLNTIISYISQIY